MPEVIQNGKRPRFQQSVDVSTIVQALSKYSPEQTATYKELSALIGRDIRTVARHVLAAARKRLERDHGVLFAAVTGIGIKRLTDSGIVGSTASDFARCKRINMRAQRRLTNIVNTEALNEHDRIRYNTALTVASVGVTVFHEKGIKRIQAKVEAAQKSLPLGPTLKAFLE